MNNKVLKTIKIVASLASVGVTLLSAYVADKELDEKITKGVSEALTKASGKES